MAGALGDKRGELGIIDPAGSFQHDFTCVVTGQKRFRKDHEIAVAFAGFSYHVPDYCQIGCEIPSLARALVCRYYYIAVGSKDFVAGSPHELAALIPGAQALEIPGRDHMLAVGDRVFKQGLLDFLAVRR